MISINSVYTAVQSVLNKDHRGFLKPEDFNNFAKIAFYNNLELIKAKNAEIKTAMMRGKASTSDLVYTTEALNMFFKPDVLSITGDRYVKPADFDYLEGLYYDSVRITEVSISDSKLMDTISNMSPSDSTPVFVEYEDGYEVLSDTIDGNIEIYYYRLPKDPKWTYVVIGNDIIYDGSSAQKQDIELPIGYFSDVVIDILFYAGMNIRDEQALDALLKDRQVDDAATYKQNIGKNQR